MVSRRHIRRIRTLTIAVLFLGAVGGDAWGYHDCPHHDAEPSSQSAHAAEHATDHSAEHAADHGSGHESGPCTCVGSCHGSASAPVLAITVEAPRTPTGAGRRLPAAVTAEPRALHAAYLLPFANGPPTG